MKKITTVISALLLGVSALSAQTVDEIMEKSCDLPTPNVSSSQLTMELFDKDNKLLESRIMRQFGTRDATTKKKKTIFFFDTPASIKGTRVLQAENVGKDDDKWVYEPSLRTVRQIAAASRKSSFVGTDFTYNDMSIRKYEDDTNKMLDENASVTIEGKTYKCWKIESTPKKKDVEFTYRYVWVDKESYLPMRIEFYDRKGLLKEWETLGYRYVKGVDGKNTYCLRNGTLVRNVRNGHATKTLVKKFEFDNPKSVKAEYFTTQWLNTGKF